nr:type II toxin-antitoxin system RelE/ParE family toxin [Bowmanella dokdonensis]
MDEIAEYIHKDSPFYASVVVEKILLSTSNLPKHPLLGRRVPEAGSEAFREVFIYDYRLIYEVLEDDQTLLVLAVLHGRRDMANLLSGGPE